MTSADQPDNPYPDAWCRACDGVRLAHGGVWNKQSEALIAFELPPSDWHNHGTESVWSKPVGPNLYEVRSVPMYAFGVSYGDTVRTREEKPFPIVESVVRRSGPPPSAPIKDVYSALETGEREGDWDFEEGHCGHAV